MNDWIAVPLVFGMIYATYKVVKWVPTLFEDKKQSTDSVGGTH